MSPANGASGAVFRDWNRRQGELVAPPPGDRQGRMTGGEANPRFLVTSLKAELARQAALGKALSRARRDGEPDKECQGDLFADRTSTATMRANQLRLWFASMAYALLCAMRRIGLAHTPFASATCGTIRLKLLKLGALVKISARRVRIAFASACHTPRNGDSPQRGLQVRAPRQPDARRRGATMLGKPSAHRRNNPTYRRKKRARATHSHARIKTDLNPRTDVQLPARVRNAG